MVTSTASFAVTSASATLPSSTDAHDDALQIHTSPSPMAAVPLTTQYVFPSDCKWNALYNFTVGTTTYNSASLADKIGFGTLVETYGYVNKTAAYYESCFQPPGKTVPYHNEFALNRPLSTPAAVYRAAVCPSKWVAIGVGRTIMAYDNGKEFFATTTYSTAHCCRSGHLLAADMWSLRYAPGPPETHAGQPSACIEMLTRTRTSEYVPSAYSGYHTFTPRRTVVENRAFYPAWTIQWMEEDNKSLDPPWPKLTGTMVVATWHPGTGVSGSGSTLLPPSEMPMTTAIPVFAILGTLVFLLTAGILVFWGQRRQSRKEAQKERVAEERSRALMIGDEVPDNEFGLGQRVSNTNQGWWERRQERNRARREQRRESGESNNIELAEREIPLG